jgi:hypothetical protein
MVSDGRPSAPKPATRSGGNTILFPSSTTITRAAGPGPTCCPAPMRAENTKPKVTIIVPYVIGSCIWEGLSDDLHRPTRGGAGPPPSDHPLLANAAGPPHACATNRPVPEKLLNRVASYGTHAKLASRDQQRPFEVNESLRRVVGSQVGRAIRTPDAGRHENAIRRFSRDV